jgi:hypothetical protein
MTCIVEKIEREITILFTKVDDKNPTNGKQHQHLEAI